MRLQQLRYFKALAEREHLFQTATELYISPPALSASISHLEEELGVPLFDHVGRNIKLNQNGKNFYHHIRIALNEIDAGTQELCASARERASTLSVITSNLSSWGDSFADFVCRNHDIRFEHEFRPMDSLFRETDNNPPDFVITNLTDAPPGQYEHLVLIPNDKPVIGVWKGHPLSGRTEIAMRELSAEPFVVLPKSYSMRRYFDELCSMAGFTPNIVAEADIQLRAKLVRDQVGILLSTEMSRNEWAQRDLHFIDVTDPVYPRVQAIFWRKGSELSAPAKRFLDHMCSYYRSK